MNSAETWGLAGLFLRTVTMIGRSRKKKREERRERCREMGLLLCLKKKSSRLVTCYHLLNGNRRCLS